MIKLLKLILVLIIYTSFTSLCFAAQNFTGFVAGVETRNSAYDAIYMYDYFDYDPIYTKYDTTKPINFPDEGCDLTDRGIIRESDPGAKTMLQAAFLAFEHNYKIFIRVDGCSPITPDSTKTAPRIVRIHIYRYLTQPVP